MTSTSAPPASLSELPAAPRRHWSVVVLALGLIVAVLVTGSPELGAPWMLGDEFLFIVGNPDVNPAAGPDRPAAPLGRRILSICTKIHDDLYQPIPIVSYAIEWELSGGSATSVRRTDLLLHALNAVLLWWVLASFLRRAEPHALVAPERLAWCLTLLWAVHPVLVTAYASDMGRTHLLSAMFALLALGWHRRALTGGRWYYGVGALAALLAAMLSKPIPGWILVAFALESLCRGWRAALRSPRVYVVAVICFLFAAITWWTSTRSPVMDDASKGLFGDPLARSGLAVWLYGRDVLVPLWLAFWYPPDPSTGWAYPWVWLGLGLAVASIGHGIWSWRGPRTRLMSFGWAWCWGLLLPVIGLVGARETAATDRYLYQPLMGAVLVLAIFVGGRLAAGAPAAATRVRWVIPSAAGAIAVALALASLPYCAVSRSVIRRAQRVVHHNPGDPRAFEALSAAYEFAQDHAVSPRDLERVPAGEGQARYFHRLWLEALHGAAGATNLSRFFPGPDDRGPFHRRLAFRFLRAGDAEASLAQAVEARQQQPNEYATWTRLAQACQALGRFEDADGAYRNAEERLPPDARTRAVHYGDHGYLLLFELERDAEACSKFAAAVATGQPTLVARLGAALCQIRYGEGAIGFQLIDEVLRDPGLRSRPALATQAGLVLAEYHLRSHHWEEAGRVYDALLHDDPTNYAALRGFQEVGLQTNRLPPVLLAWRDALQRDPTRREFRSYLVWALALAGEDSAESAARALLVAEPKNPLACLACALGAIRAGDISIAVEWVEQACAGQPIPNARALDRAAAALQVLRARRELSAEAALVQAAALARGTGGAAARAKAAALLDEYVAARPDSPWLALALQHRAELSDAGSSAIPR